MIRFSLLAVMIILITSCSGSYSLSDLEGTWENTNPLQPGTKYIFYSDSLRIFTPAWNKLTPDAAAAFDSIALSSQKDVFSCRIKGDTLYLAPALKDNPTYWRTILLLTKDTLKLSDSNDSITLKRTR